MLAFDRVSMQLSVRQIVSLAESKYFLSNYITITKPSNRIPFPLCLQVQLYEDFAKSRAKASVEDSISTASTEEKDKPKLKATGHVFQVQFVWLTCTK